MSIRIHVTGAVKTAVDTHVPTLVKELVASSITAQDPALWGRRIDDERYLLVSRR